MNGLPLGCWGVLSREKGVVFELKGLLLLVVPNGEVVFDAGALFPPPEPNTNGAELFELKLEKFMPDDMSMENDGKELGGLEAWLCQLD